MRETLLLLKAYWVGIKPYAMFLQRFGFRSRRRQNKVLSVVLAALLVITFGYFMVMLFSNYWAYQTLGMMIDRPYLGLFFAAVVSSVATLVYTLTSVSNVLYQAPDIKMLQALPIEERTLALSRLAILYATAAPIYWFFTLPAMVVAALIGGFSFQLFFGALFFLVLGPILPLSILTLIGVAIMRSRIFERSPGLSKTIAMVLFILFFVGLSSMMTRYLDQSGAMAYDYQAMIASLVPLIEVLERWLKPLLVQANALLSFSSLFWFILLSLGVGAVAMQVVVATYHSTVALAKIGGHRRANGRRATLERGRSPLVALMRRELVVLSSQNAFVFEIVGELFIPLILLVVWIITGTIGDMAALFSSILSLDMATQIIFVILLLMGNFSLLSSTSVSRQGKYFALDRLYPVEAARYVQAKLLLHLLLVGVTNIIYVSTALILIGAGAKALAWAIPLSVLSVAVIAPLQLAIDYRNPNEEWTLAQQAMKSNLNGLFGLVIALGWTVICALFLILLPLLGVVRAPLIAPLFIIGAVVARWGYRFAINQARLALSR
ncbi:MAG: hypothetical protein WC233_09490 [Sphaerochaeta sp.]